MVVWPGAERLARVILSGCEASRAIATREDGGSFTSALPAPQRWIISAVVHIIGTKSPAAAIKKGLGTGLDLVVAAAPPAGASAAEPGRERLASCSTGSRNSISRPQARQSTAAGAVRGRRFCCCTASQKRI